MTIVMVFILIIPFAIIMTYVLALGIVSTVEKKDFVEQEAESIIPLVIISVFILIIGVIIIKALS